MEDEAAAAAEDEEDEEDLAADVGLDLTGDLRLLPLRLYLSTTLAA